MIQVGICDDNQVHRGRIYELVSRVIFKYEEAEFLYFESGEAVVNAIEADKFGCDLLLLDIHMPNRNGLETAQYIRENQVDVDIIFITVSADHVFDGYTYQAFSYLLKPLDSLRLADEIGRYIMQRNSCSHCLHVSVNGRNKQIFLDKVYYFTMIGHKVQIVQKGKEEVSFYAKLSDVEQKLADFGFIRCHQSYLVNCRYIQSHSRSELVVAGEPVPISRRYIEPVRDALNQRKGGDGHESIHE